MPKLMVLEFTEEEHERCRAKAKEIIDSLKGFTQKEKWLIISTLYDTFPKESLQPKSAM